MRGQPSRSAIRAATVAAVLLFLALPGAGSAQSAPHSVSAGWAEAGVAYGWGQLACEICQDRRRSGVEVHLGLGHMLRPGFGFGTEVAAWVSESDPVRQVIGSVHLVGRIRPGNGPVHVQASLGTGHFRALQPGEGDDVRMLAPSGRLGIGAEVPLGRRYRLQPSLGVTFAAFGTLRRGDEVVWERTGYNLVRAGVGISRRGTR